MGEISITKLLVVAALIILVFGTKKLRTLGGDLGSAIKGFKKAMNEDDDSAKKPPLKTKHRRRSSLIKSNSPAASLAGCGWYGEEAATFDVAAFVVFVDAAQERCN